MIGIINIVAFILGIYLLYESYYMVKRKEEDVISFLIWTLLGLTLVILSVFPDLSYKISDLLKMSTRANTVFSFAILILYLLIFNVFKKNRKMHKEISKLNEEIAILRYKGKKLK